MRISAVFALLAATNLVDGIRQTKVSDESDFDGDTPAI